MEKETKQSKLGRLKEKVKEWSEELAEILEDTKSYIYDILKGEATKYLH